MEQLALQRLHPMASSCTKERTVDDLHRRFLRAFPRAHELFMQCLSYQFSCGIFCSFTPHSSGRPARSFKIQ